MESHSPQTDYQLKDELARSCLPAANRDAGRKLVWTNSICILFLLVGVVGARRGVIAIEPAPPLEESIPVVLQPAPLPPQSATTESKPAETANDRPAPVAVVIPQAPNISFSVPTMGSLVAPANMAEAPPLEPMRTETQIGALSSTGGGGDRPEPRYPKLAQDAGEQGTVVLLLTGDAAGNVLTVDVKSSSGFPLLDHATVEFIKHHWRLPAGAGNQLFQTSITYQLQL